MTLFAVALAVLGCFARISALRKSTQNAALCSRVTLLKLL